MRVHVGKPLLSRSNRSRTVGVTTYTVDEAAAKVGVTRRCVDKWIVANRDETGQRSYLVVRGERVPVVRTGSRWYVVAAHLDAAVSGTTAVAA